MEKRLRTADKAELEEFLAFIEKEINRLYGEAQWLMRETAEKMQAVSLMLPSRKCIRKALDDGKTLGELKDLIEIDDDMLTMFYRRFKDKV